MIDPRTTHFWLAVFIALLLWSILLWLEWRRYGNTGRVLLRAFLLLVAMTGLLGIYVKPNYQAQGAATTIVLNGEAPRTLDSLLARYPAAQVLSLGHHPEYKMLAGISYLPRHVAKGSTVFLIGDAVSEQEMFFLQSFAVQYVPEKERRGLQSLYYQKLIGAGDSVAVQGSWFAEQGDKLLLVAAGSGQDSVEAEQSGLHNFLLESSSYFTGLQAYDLYHVAGSGDTLERYPLSVQVADVGTYQLALLTAYPAAESKYLKDYLSKQGIGLQYLAQLAPGKQIEEWINLPRKPLQITPSGLSDWDLLILTSDYFHQLGRTQQDLIEKAVSRQGMGLLILADAEAQSMRFGRSNFNFATVPVQDTVQMAGQQLPLVYRPLKTLPAGWELVLQGPRGIAAAGKRIGLGRVVMSSITNSYTLRLRGAEKAYELLWSHLVQQVLPLAERQAHWQEVPTASWEHMPLQLGLYSRDSLPGIQVLGPDQQAIVVPLWQDPDQPSHWRIKFWPQQSGWHTAVAPGDTAMFWVAAGKPGLHMAQRVRLLQQKQSSLPASDVFDKEVYVQKPVPVWWFYLLFLTGMAGLWIEKKSRG